MLCITKSAFPALAGTLLLPGTSKGCPHLGGSSRQLGERNLKKNASMFLWTLDQRLKKKTTNHQERTSKASERNQGASTFFVVVVPTDPCLTQLLLCSAVSCSVTTLL